jgi:hypothetical protein
LHPRSCRRSFRSLTGRRRWPSCRSEALLAEAEAAAEAVEAEAEAEAEAVEARPMW